MKSYSTMNNRKLFQQTFGLVLAVLLVAGCGGEPTQPAATHAPALLTALPMPELTDTPAPTATLDCPDPPDPKVTVSVVPVVLEVGDTLTVVPHPSGFGLTESVSLLVDSSPLAVLDWGSGEVNVYDNIPVLRILPTAKGDRVFTLLAIGAGTVDVKVHAYGDAGFCFYDNGQCRCGTIHQGADSDPMSVTVLSSDDTSTLNEAGVVAALIQVLEGDENANARNAAAKTMGEIGPEEGVIPALVKALEEDESTNVRVAVVGALGQIGPDAAQAVPALIQALEDENVTVHVTVVSALQCITGQDFGEDAAAWRQWWEEQQK